jgi:hypothetical protein
MPPFLIVVNLDVFEYGSFGNLTRFIFTSGFKYGFTLNEVSTIIGQDQFASRWPSQLVCQTSCSPVLKSLTNRVSRVLSWH